MLMDEKIKIKTPPLPASRRDEIKIFNDFTKENNRLTSKKFIELAVILKTTVTE